MFDKFSDRHIGVTNPEDLKAMLAVIGVKSVDELIAHHLFILYSLFNSIPKALTLLSAPPRKRKKSGKRLRVYTLHNSKKAVTAD